MNNLRRMFAGMVLMLVLALSAFAGQVNCPVLTEPPTGGGIECGGLTMLVNSLFLLV